MAPAVAGGAAARDVQTRMHPLIYTTPISKADYLGGRFLAAFVLNALILLAVPLGMLADFLLAWRGTRDRWSVSSGRIPRRLRCSCVADRLHLHGGPVLVGRADPPSRRQLPRHGAVLRRCRRHGWRGDQRSSTADPRRAAGSHCPDHSGHHSGDIDTARDEYRSDRTEGLDARESTPLGRRSLWPYSPSPIAAFASSHRAE